jgi:signal transduction histidine kinase/DNA-binding response OmpR family regulator
MIIMGSDKRSAFGSAKQLLFIILVLSGVQLCRGTENGLGGFKFLHNYTPKIYKELSQNTTILQDQRGVIYAANQGGVLEYDGVSWRTIKGTEGYVSSMDIDAGGTIYVGGIGEIGYLQPNHKGALKYVSLVKQLEKKDRNRHVYQVLCTPDGVWFRTMFKLFLWSGGKIKTHSVRKVLWNDKETWTEFKNIFTWKGDTYIQEKYYGLTRLKGNDRPIAPGGERFALEKIYVAVPYDAEQNELLLGTYSKGFYRYDGIKAMPFPTEVDQQVKGQLYQGARLRDGNFALGTSRSGVIVIDRNGKFLETYNIDAGLPDNYISYVYQDNTGNLWLALNKGISKIDYESPISYFDEGSGLLGVPHSIVRHKGVLYVGTSNGLYRFEPGTIVKIGKFKRFSREGGVFFSLLSTAGSLLAAADTGIYEITGGGSAVMIGETPVCGLVLKHSKIKPGRVWVGTLHALLGLIQIDGTWQVQYRLPMPGKNIRSIEEDNDGNLFLGTRSSGVLKIDFHGDARKPAIINYGEKNGLPNGEHHVKKVFDRLRFATGKGLYSFDESAERFKPDLLLGELFSSGSRNVYRLVEGENREIYFHSNRLNYVAYPGIDGAYEVDGRPFLSIYSTQVDNLYRDGRRVWFVMESGLIGYDTVKRKDYGQEFSVQIRRITGQNGKTMYEGAGTVRQYLEKPVLNYYDRNIGIEVAAPFFDNEADMEFRYFMDGYDDDWSGWTTNAVKGYTNLDAGYYRFRVQARNVYGTVSQEDIFGFRVLPPWYFSWWAYIFYAVFCGFIVYIIVLWRSSVLVKEKQQLERIVQDRTREIKQANVRLKQKTQLLEEQSEKLKEMDKVKSRFFANISHEFRTPLTLILGPLDKIQDACQDSVSRKQIDLVHRNARRLLELINQLLDLSRLESGKMKLQAKKRDLVSFLKGLAEPFEMAAAQKRLELAFQSEEANIPVYFDPEKMVKIMDNLLSNAVKFTPPGGHIDVSIARILPTDDMTPTDETSGDSDGRTGEGYVAVSVTDTGVGIPEHQVERIFEHFYQADTAGEQQAKGSGIGLALVKELVELHHGEITVHSKVGENSGSQITLRLPLGKRHFAADEISEDHLPENRSEEKWMPPDVEPASEPHHETEEDGAFSLRELSTHGAAAKKIILLVEDNADLRDYIRSSLESDYAVREARNGVEGIEKAKKIIPDLIISDIMMPEADGYEVCRTVKSDIATSHIPVILLTARASEDNIAEGLETGADDYVTKPFNTRLLMVRIKNLIELRRQLQLKLNREMLLQPHRVELCRIDREFLKELQNVIEKNLSDSEFNVEDMSKRLYMSRTTLYRKVQALSGETPTDFIRSYRLKRAAQLLKTNFGSVTEVAFEVGFSSRAYFTKCFKEKFQCLPSSYATSEKS